MWNSSRRWKHLSNQVIDQLPATEQQIKQIREHQQLDETCCQIINYCHNGSPDRSTLKGTLKCYYVPVANELSVHDGLLLRGNRMVIPLSLHQEIIGKIHSGYQGTTKCRQREQGSVWWPGMGQVSHVWQKSISIGESGGNHKGPVEQNR